MVWFGGSAFAWVLSIACGVDHDDSRFSSLHVGEWIDRIAMQAGGGKEDCAGTQCQGRFKFAGGESVLPHLESVRCSVDWLFLIVDWVIAF